jgi:hypothetical protein
MRALAHKGQCSAALAQYERCRKLLAEDLGVEPCVETTALYEQIRAGTVARAVAGTARTPTTDPREHQPLESSNDLDSPESVLPISVPSTLPTPLTPLIGREAEWPMLSTLLRNLERRLVTLTGVGAQARHTPLSKPPRSHDK